MNDHVDNGTILERLSALQEMNIAQLREEFERHFGKPSLSRNKRQLVKRIADRIQSEAASQPSAADPLPCAMLVAKFEPKKGRSKRVAKPEQATAEKKAKVKAIGARDPRLPKPGTVISREWHGKKYLVRVLDSGFEYSGKPFRSLSAVAKHITGQIVNGFAWFRRGAKEPQKS